MNVVLDTYKQGLQRGLVLGASPKSTSLEKALSQDVASFAATLEDKLTTSARPSAPPLSSLGKRPLPPHSPPPAKKEKLSQLLGTESSGSKKHIRSSSLTSGLTALLRKKSPAGKQKPSWNPFRF